MELFIVLAILAASVLTLMFFFGLGAFIILMIAGATRHQDVHDVTFPSEPSKDKK